jgi:hypothetical protein
MERASTLLVSTRYFDCERLCLRAFALAFRARDFERLARICMPLQETRRLIRQQATDAAAAGAVRVLSGSADFSGPSAPGFYLVQPPLIGADARRLRELLWHRQVPSLVLAREPMTQSRKWPLVAVGEKSYRVQVAPPDGVEWTGQGVRRDAPTPGATGLPTVPWFLAAAEALGDAAFASIDPKLPAAWRVEDITKALDAFPDHEKLHQHLADACRATLHEPEPPFPRPRVDPLPNSF